MAKLRDRLARWLLRAEHIKLPGVGSLPRPHKLGEIEQLNLSAVWSAVGLLAGHLSSVPLNVYRRLPDGSKEKAKDHRLWNPLHNYFGRGVTSVVGREALVANIELYGVGYLYVIASAGRVELRPLWTKHVDPDPAKGVYRFTDGNRRDIPVEIPPGNMLVFPALTIDGANPLHTAQYRSRSFKLAQSYEDRAEAFNLNGAIPTAVVTWGEGYSKLSEETRQRMERKWEELYGGVSNTGGTAFLPHGSSVKEMSFNPEVLQMLGSRQFSVQEIARWFRVPPHKLGDLGRATWANIEHMQIEYVQDSLLPRTRKIESVLNQFLIADSERDEYFIEFDLNGLQRGDFNTRMQAYAQGRQWGWMSANDIRRLENMDQIPEDAGGDVYLVPMNMAPSGQPPRPDPFRHEQGCTCERCSQPPEQRTGRIRASKAAQLKARSSAAVRRQITESYKPAFERAGANVVGQEIRSVSEAIGEFLPDDMPGFFEWLDEFYDDEAFGETVKSGFQGLARDFAETIERSALEELGFDGVEEEIDQRVADYLKALMIRHIGSSRNQLKQVLQEAAEAAEDLREAAEQRLSEWGERRSEKIAMNESVRAENLFARSAWMSAGVTRLTWVTSAGNCEYCGALEGVVVGIQDAFVGAGSGVSGADGPLMPSTNIRHPPLHEGCVCSIAPLVM